MEVLEFQTEKPLHMNWIGKFQAPDENWIHMARKLTDFELVIVTEGDFFIGEGDNEYVVRKGEYRLICPTFQHGTKKSYCEFYWFHFTYNENRNNPIRYRTSPIPFASSSKKSEQTGEEKRILLPLQGKVPKMNRLIVLLKQLQDCDKKYGNQNMNDYMTTAILCELYSQIYLSSANLVVKGAQVQLYSDLVNYINWRIREDIRVQEIADYFGYNVKYITTFFKKVSGVSIKQYILNQKIEEAKAMLNDSTKPVSQICYDLGFSDNHNFAKLFKKMTGQTPSEYRDTYSDRMLFHK